MYIIVRRRIKEKKTNFYSVRVVWSTKKGKNKRIVGKIGLEVNTNGET